MTFNNKENIRTQSGQKMPLQLKSTSKAPLTAKNNNVKTFRTEFAVKRNQSNSYLQKPALERDAKTIDSQSVKPRYNSCSIRSQRCQRSNSHFASAAVEASHKQSVRIKQKYSYRTRQGVQISNPNKVNQDSLLIKTNLAERETNLYAVADGHGVYGHFVSQFIVKNLSKLYEH
jgi:hypothetical protein